MPKGAWALEPYGRPGGKGGWKGGKNKDKGPAPGEEVLKIFVGGLPPTAGEEDLNEFFSTFGEISVVELKSFPMTGKHRGFGFVTFTAAEAAQAVLDNYDHNMIHDKW